MDEEFYTRSDLWSATCEYDCAIHVCIHCGGERRHEDAILDCDCRSLPAGFETDDFDGDDFSEVQA